jgi:hypothetical protein
LHGSSHLAHKNGVAVDPPVVQLAGGIDDGPPVVVRATLKLAEADPQQIRSRSEADPQQIRSRSAAGPEQLRKERVSCTFLPLSLLSLMGTSAGCRGGGVRSFAAVTLAVPVDGSCSRSLSKAVNETWLLLL